MKFNYESIKEDTRKIGVALIIAGLVTGLLKDIDLLDALLPVFLGVILIAIGTRENDNE